MKIANVLAGFTLGDADLLRRAMGKKKPEEMAQQREKFAKGSAVNQIPEKKAEKIFDLMEKFAGYGFNKSHSAAYALISYQTAYLKAHYPLQFFGALITSDMDNTDKVIRYINDAREIGIQILPPDVNQSQKDFSISQDQLLFGLGAIKNVGSAAIDQIIENREAEGSFESLKQFCERLDLRQVNKRVIESLIKSGACDSLDEGRASMMHHLQMYMDMGQARQRDRQLGQSSMFDAFEEEAEQAPAATAPVNEWSDHDRLRFEKETIGFYVSGHPLTRYQKDIDWFTDSSSASISEQDNGKAVSLAGVPFKVIPKTTRRGDKMALVTLEDLQGTVEVTLWPETYAASEQLLALDEPILVKGTVESVDNLPKVIAKEVFPLSEAKNHWKGKVHVQIRTPGLEKEMLVSVRKVLAEHQGTNALLVHFIFPDSKARVRTVESDMKVRPSDDVIREIEELLGEDSIYFE